MILNFQDSKHKGLTYKNHSRNPNANWLFKDAVRRQRNIKPLKGYAETQVI